MNRRIGWVVPDILTEGSGGVLTIWNHIRTLADLYQQDVYIHRTGMNESDTLRLLELNYGKVPDSVNLIYGHDNIKPGYDLLIATWSLHAYKVRNTSAKQKAYFIQDLEYMFFPVSDFAVWATESYNYGFIPITIGKYMQRILNNTMHVKPQAQYYFDFCADLNTYRPLDEYAGNKEKAVCFLYQPEKPRRCAEVGLKALRILKTLMPDLTVYLYGSREKGFQPERYPEFVNLGLLSREECNELYNKCKLGMAFSPTNPSRIPFEMMSAGLPVVDLPTDNKDDFAEDTLILPQSTSYEHIAIAAYEVLNDYTNWINRRNAGVRFMRARDLSVAYNQFRDIIGDILKDV